MSTTPRFGEARLGPMMLAKVGNPLKGEPVRTSKALCSFSDEDADLLTHCFLKPFRSLEPHRFERPDAGGDGVYARVLKVFDHPASLLEEGAQIARDLHAKSTHPNIKPGDLCVGLIEGVVAGGEATRALAIIKSESKVPFLQVSVEHGDLTLRTQQGIYPDKIDKGCLIVDHGREDGCLVSVFDRSGSTYFWNRDFLGVAPVRDESFHTRRYSELCTAFAERGLPEGTPQEERLDVANRALSYLADHEQFELGQFQEAAFEGEPETAERFAQFKSSYEDEYDLPLDDSFAVAQAEAKKAKKRLKGRLKLDTGVDVRFSSGFIDQADKFFERGFDERRHMQFVKIYYHTET